jgi:hypothetical protein
MGTYTDKLALYKPDIGETGWGDEVNTNFDTIDGENAARSASAYASVTETLLAGGGDCESTTGWTKTNISTIQTSATNKTQGSYGISFGGVNVGWQVNPDFTTQAYLNLTGDVSRGNALHVAIDFRWQSTDVSEDEFPRLFEFVLADAVDLGGNTVTWRIPYAVESTFETVRIPITALTKVRSVGFRAIAHTGAGSSTLSFGMDNIRFSAQTSLEHALGANPDTAVVVPADYDATGQVLLPLTSASTIQDLRSDHVRVRGERDVREFQIPLDGVTDVTDDLRSIFSWLQPGDRLVFPSGYRFLVSGSMKLNDLRNVEIDFGGSRLYTQQSAIDGSLLHLVDCQNVKIGNVRLYGYSPRTNLGSAMTTHAGTPVVNGTTVELDAQGDAVRLAAQNQGYTVDDEIPFDITVRQSSGSVVHDLGIEIVTDDAPSSAPTLTAAGQSEGGLAAGTYYYAVAYSDIDGRETSIGPITSITLAAGDAVNLSDIPVAMDGQDPMVQIRGRNIYRTITPGETNELRNFALVRQIPDNSTVTYYDNGRSTTSGYKPNEALSAAVGSAGSVEAGDYYYQYTTVTSAGTESGHGGKSPKITVSTPSRINVTVPVATGAGVPAKRKIYRTAKNPAATNSQFYFFYVGEVTGNAQVVFEDNVPDASLGLNPPADRPSGGDIPAFAEDAVRLTPGTQDSVMTFTWRPVEQRRPYLIARKVSADTNTITISQCAMTTYAQYDQAAEGCSGVDVDGTSENIEIHDVFATLMGSDAVYVGGAECRGITARRIFSYGCRRQGMATASGHNVTFEDCEIHHPGRSAIDVEPYGEVAFTTNVHIRDVRMFNPKNYGLASVNYHAIRGLFVDNVYVYGSGSLGWGVGAQGGSISHVTCWWGGASMVGQNMSMDNCQFDSLTLEDKSLSRAGTPYVFTTGGHRISNVRLLKDEFVNESSNNIIESVYLISGPGAGSPTITDITPP